MKRKIRHSALGDLPNITARSPYRPGRSGEEHSGVLDEDEVQSGRCEDLALIEHLDWLVCFANVVYTKDG
ncbi:hypothetical protein GN958_ATG11252 [Phytophthora infestans]|uniref:Uncharacterized protein n=1 Tax=Phytophthora infestans TaxID=4787 RepID=A0A8S9UF03_PHYIN|nr:hypothetical protein GN958_ATG11252 [Phytophthora infestans]